MLSAINTTLNINNYKVAFIAEGYAYDNTISDFAGVFLTENERQIVENYVEAGGHVVWLSENWEDYSNSTAPYQTVNTIFGTNIIEGPFFSNQGYGSNSIFRIHPSMGPAGLSLEESVMASGSYGTMLNVPNCSKLYTSDSFDPSGNTYDACTHTVLAVFPSRPKPNDGSIILSSEIGLPFQSFTLWGGMDPVTVYNEELDSSIALLHYKLIVEENTNELNDWLDLDTNINPGCPPNVARYILSDTIVCTGDTIFFTHAINNEVLFYTTQDTGYVEITITNTLIDGTCYDDTIVHVRYVNPIVDAGVDKTICEGQELVLVANNPSNGILNWNNGVVDNQPFIPQESKTYTVASSLHGCSYKDSVIINLIEKPILSLNQERNISACIGDELTLNATAQNNAIISWDNDYANNTPLIVENSINYMVTATIESCVTEDSISIIAMESPYLSIGNDTSICKGKVILLNAQSNGLVFWNSTIANNNFIFPSITTTYVAEASLNGCITKDSLEISVHALPQVEFETEIDFSIENKTLFQFLNATDGGTNNDYLWNFGDSSNLSSEYSPTHQYSSSETHFVDVKLLATNPFGCIDSIIKTFKIDANLRDSVFIPIAFTPNRDMNNEVFKPVYNLYPRQYVFLIFNRWGELLFETTNPEYGWDGKHNNRLVQDGIFTYKLLFNNKLKIGTFHLIGKH